MAFVSFCMSTYKRPEILYKQLQLLTQQTFSDFEVVISDNDTEESARNIVESLNDNRFKYYANKTNLGMIKSFNKSIERASSDYIVMITDDDPLDIHFLEEMVPLIEQYPNKSLYCGFLRKSSKANQIEEIKNSDFPVEVLHPKKNPSIFWTNCILCRADVLKVGLIPDYGSPHLADHALLTLVGSINGSVVKNKIYSSHYQHENNYSKGNFDSYYDGCVGFYNFLTNYFKSNKNFDTIEQVIYSHLKHWFISMSFTLRRYFYKQKNSNKLLEIDEYSNKILALDFMKKTRAIYNAKKIIFIIKASLQML